VLCEPFNGIDARTKRAAPKDGSPPQQDLSVWELVCSPGAPQPAPQRGKNLKNH